MATRVLIVALVVLLTVAAPQSRAVQNGPADVAGPPLGGMPVVSDHRYRASGAVRPFLLFWISRDNVGGARITRRQAPDGSVSLEMLTGSDPQRAPFGTNRWGYIREVIRGQDADLVAVKTDTAEETIEEAKSAVRNKNARGTLVFIREHVSTREAVAWSAIADVGRDVSFRDLDFVLERMRAVGNWQERRIARPPDARPGFLTAFTDMMDSTAKVWSSAPAKRDAAPRMVTYIHRAELFDLHQDQIESVDSAAIGNGEHVAAVRARFRVWNRQSKQWSGDFVALYGVSGALAGVPLRLTYQPRWWLRTELTLDDAAEYSAATPR
jgi:hypothetical protein